MEHYEQIAQRLDHLAELHEQLADVFDLLPNQKHAEGDHALAEAERRSAETCLRVAASIRTRLQERST